MKFRGRPARLWVLLVALGQLSVRASVGGAALLIAPSGELIGLSLVPLDGTLFRDFLVPGITLFVVFGLVPVVVCYAVYTRRQWGWFASVGVAVALVVWVIVEVTVGFDRPTIYLNLGTAWALLVLSAPRSVGYARRSSGEQ
jgi:hypothetical protein